MKLECIAFTHPSGSHVLQSRLQCFVWLCEASTGDLVVLMTPVEDTYLHAAEIWQSDLGHLGTLAEQPCNGTMQPPAQILQAYQAKAVKPKALETTTEAHYLPAFQE